MIEGTKCLISVFQTRRKKKRHSYRNSKDLLNKIDDMFIDIVVVFAELWERTQYDDDWTEHDILDFGVLTNSKGKCRPIPQTYKLKLVEATRTQGSLEGDKLLGVLRGLNRAATPRKFRLCFKRLRSEKDRKLHAKKLMRTAKSQLKTGHPGTASFATDLCLWERYGYFKTSKAKAENQKRFSLALDATDVSRKKVMNATICLPQSKDHFWLPPMDSASSIFPH